MLIPGVRDFFYSWSGKKPPSTIVCDADGSTSQKQCNYNKYPLISC